MNPSLTYQIAENSRVFGSSVSPKEALTNYHLQNTQNFSFAA